MGPPVVPWHDFDAFLIDLDGVVYLGGAAIPGAAETVAEELAAAGLRLVDGEVARRAEVVVVGGHDSLGYQEVRLAAQAVRNGAAFYATGRDATFPIPDGPWPATGAMLAAVEVAAGKQAVVAGKPEPLMFEMACRDFADRRKVAVVGDTLESDIAGGKKAGLVTILVLSGSTKPGDLAASPIKPDYILPSLAALVSGSSGRPPTR